MDRIRVGHRGTGEELQGAGIAFRVRACHRGGGKGRIVDAGEVHRRCGRRAQRGARADVLPVVQRERDRARQVGRTVAGVGEAQRPQQGLCGGLGGVGVQRNRQGGAIDAIFRGIDHTDGGAAVRDHVASNRNATRRQHTELVLGVPVGRERRPYKAAAEVDATPIVGVGHHYVGHHHRRIALLGVADAAGAAERGGVVDAHHAEAAACRNRAVRRQAQHRRIADVAAELDNIALDGIVGVVVVIPLAIGQKVDDVLAA